MGACVFGRDDTVAFWLSKFLKWDLNRGNSINGATALHCAVYAGRNKYKTFLALLKNGRANLDVLADSGASVLSNAVKNVDSGTIFSFFKRSLHFDFYFTLRTNTHT